MHKPKFQKRSLFMLAYVVFALLPIYWMINMSFKTNNEIVAGFSLLPNHFTWDNYKTILSDVAWYSGYINSLIYVGINTVISLCVALPAAYAFSRYSFLGDKHVFFLAIDQPHDAACGVFAAILSALHLGGLDGYTHCRGAGAPAVQRALGRLDFGRFYERYPTRDR